MDRPHDHYDGIGTLFFIPCNFTSNSLQRIASLKGTFPLMNNLWLEMKHLDQQSLHRLKNFQKKVNDNTKCFITFTYIYIYTSSRDSLLFFLYHWLSMKRHEAKIVRQVFLDQCRSNILSNYSISLYSRLHIIHNPTCVHIRRNLKLLTSFHLFSHK